MSAQERFADLEELVVSCCGSVYCLTMASVPGGISDCPFLGNTRHGLCWAKVLRRGPFSEEDGDIWTAVSRNRIKLGQSKKDDPTPNPRKGNS